MAAEPTTPEMQELDPEDLLSDSLQTLYDYAPITHSSAGSLFRYTLPQRSEPTTAASDENPPTPAPNAAPTDDARVITLVTPTTQATNWALHASSIWTSALFVADHVADLNLDAHTRAVAEADGPRPLRVLELGAGAGLPSIVIAKTHPGAAVTASDYPDAELVAALAQNVQRNGVGDRVRVVPYAWGSDPAAFGDGAFDVIVAADTLWNPELHALFLGTLQRLLHRTPDARAYLVAGLHTGRYTLQAFMDAVGEYGLALEEAVEREVGGSRARPWDVARAEGEDERERRRWVVDMRIKWKLS